MNPKPFGIALLVLAVVLCGYFLRVRDSFSAGEFRYDHSPGATGFFCGVVLPIVLAGFGVSLLLRRGGGR